MAAFGDSVTKGEPATSWSAGRWLRPALSVLALLVLWEIAASLIDVRTLPDPIEVAHRFVEASLSGELPYNLVVTLWRVVAAFVLAMAIGTAIGIAMGRSRLVDSWFDSWLIVLLNLPALVTIVLAYVWFGLTEAAAVGAVAINKIPNVVVTVREGARALDPDLDEMAESFRLGRWARLRHVVLPQLYPYLSAAGRSGLALIWKIVLVVELLGRSNGMGFQIHLFFQLFDVTGILAYTLAFILVIQVLELLVVQPIERHANRWRR